MFSPTTALIQAAFEERPKLPPAQAPLEGPEPFVFVPAVSSDIIHAPQAKYEQCDEDSIVPSEKPLDSEKSERDPGASLKGSHGLYSSNSSGTLPQDGQLSLSWTRHASMAPVAHAVTLTAIHKEFAHSTHF